MTNFRLFLQQLTLILKTIGLIILALTYITLSALTGALITFFTFNP